MTFVNASAAIAAHTATTTNVHGTGAGNAVASDNDISTHAAVTQNVHGVGANDIADVADISTHAAVTTNVHGTGAGNVIVGNDELGVFIKSSSGTYTGNGSVNRAIGHGLGAAPKFVVFIRAAYQGSLYMVHSCSRILYVDSASGMNKEVTPADSTNFYVGNSGGYSQTANGNGEIILWSAYT